MSYTQDPREQALIEATFKGQTGTVLDIGAADGITFSNSAWLIEQGWSAVLVEPAPWYVQALAERYKAEIERRRVYVIQAAMVGSPDRGPMPFHLCYRDGEPAMVNTLGGYVKDTWSKDHEYRTIDVMPLGWGDLWEWWPSRVSVPEFVSIDAEGASIDILNKLGGCLPRLIAVEANNDGEYREVQAWAETCGYTERLRTDENVWIERVA